MRILGIDIENLASLRGRQPHLALADGELRDAGLIAITGATGAGKTTILDAVCLALFDQTPRLKDRGQDPRELLSRGAGEASATVRLELDDGRRWIVEWAVHRARNAPDGNLQPSRRRILDAATGDVVADGKTEVAAQLESVLGLDFDQFTGVILLAQGEFAKFLEAGDADRSQLLERLTGTEIYSLLSQGAFERHRERQEAVRAVVERLQDVRTLGDEARRAVEDELDHLAPRLVALQRQLDDLEQQRQWFERLDTLRRHAGESKASLARAQQAWDAADGDRQRLDLAERAALLAAPLESATASRRTADEAATALADATTALDEARQQRQTALGALAGSLARFDAARRVLDARVEAVAPYAQATESRLEALRDALRACRQGATRLVELRAQQTALARQAEDAEALRAEHEGGRVAAAQQVERLRARREELAAKRDELTGGRSPERLKERQIRLEQALQVHADFAQLDLEQLRADEKAARVAEKRARTAVDKARDAVSGRRAELSAHEKVLELALEGAKLAEHRHLLQDGMPCPLCGAEDHPWSDHPSDETSEALEGARHRSRELRQAADAAEERLGSASETLAAATAESARIEERRQSAEHEIARLRGSWLELRLQIVELPQDPTEFDREGPRTEAAELKSILDQLRPIEKQATDNEASLHDAEQVLHRHETQLEVAKERLEGLSSRRRELTAAESTAAERFDGDLGVLAGAASELASRCGLDSPRRPAADDPEHLDLGSFDVLLRRAVDGRAAYRSADEARRQADEIERGPARRGRQLLPEASAVDANDADDVELTELSERLDADLHQSESADGRCQVLADRLRVAEKNHEAAARRLDEAESRLRDALLGSPFADEAGLREASLDGEAMRLLRGRLDELRQAQIRRAADDERSQAELSQHLENAPIDIAAGDPDSEVLLRQGLRSDLDAVRLRHRETSDRHKELEIVLAKDDDERARLGELSAELKHLEAARDRAARLYDLIGHKKGDKFRRYAQQLNLDQLLELANLRLDLLEPRYQLARRDEGLELEVIDQEMADERRPVTTLSGGESFLVSMALALALADLRRGTLELGTLFLDEGFGSLDEDTLDKALSVLEQLQADQQTQILVISHVGALQERIAHRIDVRKLGGGQSELRVRVAGID